ncbi:hypothetical protein Gotur_009952 [Gossypium turneri]
MSSISQQISEILSSTHEWTLSVRPYVSLAAPSALKCALGEYAVNITRGAITDTVEHLFQRHNIPLPPNWTYGQLVTDILGNDLTLQNVSSVLQNITQLGLARRGVSQKERPPKVTTTKIRIVIRSFDHPFMENLFWGLPPYTRKIGLPESRVLYTVLRSPHIDKKSREQFEMEIKKQFLGAPTPPCPALYLTLRRKRGYEAWETMQEVFDTAGFPFRFTECDLGHDGSLRASVGKRSPEYSTRSPFLAAMGSTCKQGKPNGNQKTGGYRIGQKTIQKAKAHPAEGRSFGSSPYY